MDPRVPGRQVTDRRVTDRRVSGRRSTGRRSTWSGSADPKPFGPGWIGRRRQIWQPADRGSATIWLLGFLSLVLLISGVAVIQTLAVLARHRADTAADLAALAAAQRIGLDPDPCAAARRVAAENSATLTACSAQLDPAGRTGTVTVRLSRAAVLPLVGQRRVTARARAGRLPGHPPAGYPGAAARPAGVVADSRQRHPTEPRPRGSTARWCQELVRRRVSRG